MSITAPLRANPFFTGSSSTSDLVPFKYPVSIDGRPYMVDTVMAQDWRHETVPLLRPQSDDSTEPGQVSLNPDGVWRRAWTSWHKGAGQINRDREDSSPFRFQESRGVDVFERHQLSLLPAVDQKRTSSATNLKVVPAGNRLFLTDGADVVYTEDITVASPTWTACTNEPGGTILDIASDGRHVWITDGSNSYWADATAAPPAFNLAGWTGTQDADHLGWVKGRLLSGDDSTATLHTYDASGGATAVTIAATIPTTGWNWVGFAAGPTNAVIYAAGYAGDKSLILRIGIKEDGTGLDAAIVAAELPDGEIVRSIGAYLGFVFVGTDNGVRFASPDTSSGDLTLGAELFTNSPCRCFEGQGNHVWFGWDTFTESTITGSLTGEDWHGLGRFSLEEFSSAENLAPAYATDLMVQDLTGGTSSVATFQDRRVFCVEGTNQGVYAQEATPTVAGYVLSGLTDFGFVGDKTATEIDVAYNIPVSGTIGAQVEVDDTGASSTPGTITAASAESGTRTFDAGPLRGSRFNVLIALATVGSTSPTVTSYALKSIPAIRSTRKISIPLLLNEHLDPDGGIDYLDVDDERHYLVGLWETRTPVTVKELGDTFTAVLEDYQWMPRQRGDSTDGFAVDGTFVVLLKEI